MFHIILQILLSGSLLLLLPLLLPILHPMCTILVEGVVVATATTYIFTSDDIVEARATKPTADDGAMEGQEEDSEAEKNSEHSSDEEAEAKKEV